MSDERVGPCGEHCAVVDECDERGREITRLRAENEKLRAENEDLQGELKFERHNTSELFRVVIEPRGKEIEKLRAALKPLADEVEYVPSQMDDDDWYEMDTIKVGHIRAAAAALKETHND